MNGKTFAFFTCLGSITNGWQKLFKSHLCSLISASSPRIDPRHTGSWSQNPVVFLSHLRSILLNLRLSIRTSDWGSIWWRGLGDQLWHSARMAKGGGLWGSLRERERGEEWGSRGSGATGDRAGSGSVSGFVTFFVRQLRDLGQTTIWGRFFLGEETRPHRNYNVVEIEKYQRKKKISGVHQ